MTGVSLPSILTPNVTSAFRPARVEIFYFGEDVWLNAVNLHRHGYVLILIERSPYERLEPTNSAVG